MQLEQLDLPGGGLLTVYLRDCVETMPLAMERPLVLVVPGGGYSHVSAREWLDDTFDFHLGTGETGG